jgi:hypothetical protein
MNSQYRKIKGRVRDGVRDPFLVEQNTTSNVDRMPGPTIYRRRAKAAATELEHEWAVILLAETAIAQPLTRRITADDRPKQFCPVAGDLTLVEETQGRVALELENDRTVFVLNRLHEAYYWKILGSTLISNLIEQPRNVGRHLAFSPQASVGLFPSDHYVSDNRGFMAHIGSAFETARSRQDLVILLGMDPESPETEYS